MYEYQVIRTMTEAHSEAGQATLAASLTTAAAEGWEPLAPPAVLAGTWIVWLRRPVAPAVPPVETKPAHRGKTTT